MNARAELRRHLAELAELLVAAIDRVEALPDEAVEAALAAVQRFHASVRRAASRRRGARSHG